MFYKLLPNHPQEKNDPIRFQLSKFAINHRNLYHNQTTQNSKRQSKVSINLNSRNSHSNETGYKLYTATEQ